MEKAFLILLACVSISMMGLGIISPIMPMYAESLGATGIWIGLIYSSFSLSRAFLMTPIGRVSDFRSKKKIICLGLGIYTIISILYVLAWNPLSIVLIRFVHGAASSMVMPIAMAYVVDLTPEGKEGRYTGMMNTALFAGFGAGPLLGGYMSEYFSYASSFYLMAAFVSFGLFLSILFLPEKNKLNLKKRKRSRKPRMPLRKILSNKRLQATFAYRFINAFGRGSIMGFLPLLAVKSLGISTSIIGLILSAGIFANAFSQTPMGIIADKYNKTVLIIIGGLMGSLGYFYIAVAKSVFDLTASRLIVAVGGAISLSALTGLAAEEGRDLGAGSTMGMLNTAMSMGQIAGPIISGVLLDLYNMQSVFNFGGIVGLISVVLFYLLIY